MFSSEIKSIQFGVLSKEEILATSVCKITNSKFKTRVSHNNINNFETVYDERMGPIISKVVKKCISCGMSRDKCPGHFGHIELAKPVVNPLYVKHVLNFLRIFCVKCSKLLMDKTQICTLSINKYSSMNRMEVIYNTISSMTHCMKCNHKIPKINYNTTTYSYEIMYDKEDAPVILDVSDILSIFQNISKEDVSMCGLNPNMIHPVNLIVQCLPVISHISRPYIMAGVDICDDDLTNQYIEIIKSNKIINTSTDNDKIKKAENNLYFRISTLFNNTNGKAKHPMNNKPIKGLKERISGKTGQIRMNIMGKRVDYSARTVAGANSYLPFGVLEVPEMMTKELTIPEIVRSYNIDYMRKLIEQDKINYIDKVDDTGKLVSKINVGYAVQKRGIELHYGDIIIRNGRELVYTNRNYKLIKGDRLIRNGNEIELQELDFPHRKSFVLKDGYIVHRQIQDGDYVLLNRQPTLHSGSVMGFKIKIHKHKTFRTNLSCTASFNLDFDGDELNIHVPQSYQSIAEIKECSSVKNHIIGTQSGKPNIRIVQDTLLGSYLMTSEDSVLPKDIFQQLCCSTEPCSYTDSKMKNIRKITQKYGKPMYSGRTLLSTILPDDFEYRCRNEGMESEPEIIIERGVIVSGAFTKDTLGSSHNSLIKIIYNEYGVDIVSNFITNIQFIVRDFMVRRGFSVGLRDCMIPNSNVSKTIKGQVKKCFIEAVNIEENTHINFIKEMKVTAALNKAKDVGMKISKDNLLPNNNFLSTVKSGSKGDFFNITQLTSLLGQQNIEGCRVSHKLLHNTRSLPHYPKNLDDISVKEHYESRGFIRHSFIEGLNPKEFLFHAMSGREGIYSTAMSTAKSGYIQRRIVKVCEDMQIQQDGSVRNSKNHIFSFNHTDDNIDIRNKLVRNKKFTLLDVEHAVTKLNNKYEDLHECS